MIDYEAHYRTKDVTAAQLWVDVKFLRELKRFPEVEQALLAYLKFQSKKAEPWMYLLLATAYEINGRGQEAAKTAVGWAGYLARSQGDPFTLIEVADVMLLRDFPEIEIPRPGVAPVRASELLETAYEKAPHRAEPLLMMLLLAERTKDAELLAKASERMLALGWPGTDEAWRQGVRRRLEAFAKELEVEGEGEEARALIERLEAAWNRDLVVRLTWKGDAGLELKVTEPLGAVASISSPRTVFGGAIVASGRGKRAESLYTCPRGFSGKYRVEITVLYDNDADPAREVTLEIVRHEGRADEKRDVRTISDLGNLEPIEVELSEGRRTSVLPFSAPTRLKMGAELVEGGESVENVTEENRPGSAARAADLLRPPARAGTDESKGAETGPIK